MIRRLFTLIAGSTIALSMLGAPTTLAQTAPDAQTLLDRWADAIGGRDRLAEIRSEHTRSAIEVGGMTGTAENWTTIEGKARETFDLGGIYKMLTVYDGTQGWRVDHNGKLQEIQGVALQDRITSSYLSSYSQFFPERMPGSIEEAIEDSSGTNWLVKISPEGGGEVAVALDKVTSLPSYYIEVEDDRLRHIYLSDWREVDGIKIPFQVRQSTGDPRYDVLISVQEVDFNPDLAAISFDKPEEKADDFRFTNGSPALNIPFELVNNHIYVKATVNGHENLDMIFDTGAGATVLNADYTDSLGIETQGRFEGRGTGEKSADVSVIKDCTLALPGVELWDQTMMAISLGALEPYEGQPIHGIIGYDLISRFIVEIDYEHSVINLYNAKTYVYSGEGDRLPIVLEHNTPRVSARIRIDSADTVEAHFSLDTGARSALHLSSPYCEQHRLADRVKVVEGGYGAGVGGETRQSVGRIPTLFFGKYTLSDVVAGFSRAQHGAMASHESDGLLGGDILRRFTVILDYDRLEMILEPNSDFGKPFEYDMSGMFLATTPDFNAIEVRQLVPESPAAKAGIRKGDIITHLDGEPVGKYTLYQVRKMFMQDGKTYTLTVDRESKPVDLKMTLKRIV